MAYRPPGVDVRLKNQSTVATIVGGGQVLVVAGVAPNFPQSLAEQIRLTGADAVALAKTGIDSGTLNVSKGGVLLTLNTDYEVTQTTDALGKVHTTVNKKATQVNNESKTFTGAGDTQSLAHANVVPGSVVVTDSPATLTYDLGSDYSVDTVTGTITQNPAGNIGPTDTVLVDYKWTTTADGTTLDVDYDQTPEDLYELKNWDNLFDAISFYGPAMSSDTINAPISLALSLMGQAAVGALLPEIRTLAIDPAKDNASNPSQVDQSDWALALDDDLGGETITHLAPLSGDRSILGVVKSFLNNLETSNRKYTRGFAGVDAATKLLDFATGATPILGFNSSRMQLLHPEQFPWVNPATGNLLLLPAYYAAAVYALQDALLKLNQNLTHDSFGGGVFPSLPSTITVSENNKNKLAASGVTVIENFGTGLRVRHAKTMAITLGAAYEEPSVVRSLDFIRADLRESFDAQFIGNDELIDDDTILAVKIQAQARFAQYMRDGVIRGYSNVEVVQQADPRGLLVTANIVPQFPLNNIDFELTVLV